MAPKNKFTREEMVAAALHVVRRKGEDALTAKALAEELGTSTQPVFTCFGTMDALRAEVFAAAEKQFVEYIQRGLGEETPFLGFGMYYISFAREEPILYRMLLLAPNAGTMELVDRVGDIVCPRLMEIYRITEPEARRYFRDMWLVAHSVAALAVTGVALDEEELRRTLTGFSVGILRSIKEIPGFVDGTFDKDAIFKKLVAE